MKLNDDEGVQAFVQPTCVPGLVLNGAGLLLFCYIENATKKYVDISPEIEEVVKKLAKEKGL